LAGCNDISPVGGTGALGCKTESVGGGVCPNMNYELLIDDVELECFESMQITDTNSALSGFTLKIGNPNGQRTHRYLLNSRIEFKASWGNRAPETQIIGFIKQRKFDTGKKRIITLQGLDFGDLLLRKRAWDPNKNPITFNNERASSIIQQLIYFVPEISLGLTRMPDEPRMDWTTDPTSKVILDEAKAILEYAGYEFFFSGTRLIVRPPKALEEASASFNLVFGRYDRYAAVLPELPYVWLLNSNVGEDAGAIRNVYTVQGAADIKQTARNEASIQRYQGEFEGYYSDASIVSDQTAQLVARRLADINGVPRTNISVAHRGSLGFNTGDVVGVGDVNGGFSMLTNPYLRVVNKSQTYGKTWNCSTQLGTLKRDLSELL